MVSFQNCNHRCYAVYNQISLGSLTYFKWPLYYIFEFWLLLQIDKSIGTYNDTLCRNIKYIVTSRFVFIRHEWHKFKFWMVILFMNFNTIITGKSLFSRYSVLLLKVIKSLAIINALNFISITFNLKYLNQKTIIQQNSCWNVFYGHIYIQQICVIQLLLWNYNN